MVFVKKFGKRTVNGKTVEIWFWADEEKEMACFANKAELAILFQKKFKAELDEMIRFCMARDMWQSFRVSANENVIVMKEA